VPDRSDDVLVGAFNFSESGVLAEVYAQVIEDAGADADVLGEVASREIMEPALEQGEIDFVPEYLGTALTFLGDHEVPADVALEDAHALLVEDFGARGVRVLAPAPGQNRNEIVVTAAYAAEHSLEAISDLARVDQDAIFGGPAECPARPLCMVGLEQLYDLSFSAFTPLDSGGPATVAALAGGEVDVALLFTTNPQIARRDLVVLEDDRNLQPPENVVPVLRARTAEALGASVLDAVDRVTARLSDDGLRTLNGLVEVDGLTPAEAATSWLESQGLLRGAA
jgi:osmoprotectant transport system substrate-binding protein